MGINKKFHKIAEEDIFFLGIKINQGINY